MALLFCALAFLLIFYLWSARGASLRLAFVSAAAIWSLLLWVFTEVLSFFHLITRIGLLSAWSLACLGLLVAVFRSPRPALYPWLQWPSRLSQLSWPERLMASAIVLILLITALNAFLAPPNTDDAMEYHLSRMVMWADNHSVSFFPTEDVAQLIHSPWAEYADLHFYVLSGSDRFLNFIEWFSFLGCVVGASLIAQFFGGSRLYQLLAALLVATLPEAILESSGCNNTAVGAFWILSAVVFLLFGGAQPDNASALLAGLSLGFAVLTKGTSAAFMPGVLLAILIILKPKVTPTLVRELAVIVLAALFVNVPQSIRNVGLTGHPLGPPYPEAGLRLRFRAENLSPSGVFCGVVRNAAVHLSVPSAKVNALTEKSLRKLIRLAGADPDDPRNTWRDLFRVPSFTTREYFAGNLPQFLLFFLVGFLAVFRLRPFLTPPIWLMAGCAFAFVCFSAAVRWNPSASRFHLPLFVVACPAIAVLLPRVLPQRIVLALALLAFLPSLLYISDNGLRSLLPEDRTSVFRNSRDQLYFMDDYRQDEFGPYSAALLELERSGCTNVGLDTMFQSYIYPFMALANQSAPAIQFQYSGVANATVRYAANVPRPSPCAVVCLGCMRIPGKWSVFRPLHRATVIAGDDVVFWPGGQVEDESPAAQPTTRSAQQLALDILKHRDQLQSLPVFASVSAHHELDSPFQTAAGAALRAKRDLIYELRMRSDHIYEWTEPLRERAMDGLATPRDVLTLTMADDAMLDLIDLIQMHYAEFSSALPRTTSRR